MPEAGMSYDWPCGNTEDVYKRQAYISRNSAAGYYSTFRALLKIAYKEKLDWKEVKKEYLILDEVKKLAATPCKIPVLKQASLFACMTGLRISDIPVSYTHLIDIYEPVAAFVPDRMFREYPQQELADGHRTLSLIHI